MPRKRPLSWKETANSLRDLCLKNNYDPAEEMFRMLKEEVTDEQGNKVPLFVHMMGPRDGFKCKVDMLKHLNEGLRPKLRSTETHGENHTFFNITIKQVGALAHEKVVQLARPKAIIDVEG